MLGNSTPTAVLPIADMKRATRFYTESLGLRDTGVKFPDGSRVLTTGNNWVQLLQAEEGSATKHTVLTFEVGDIAAEVKDLESHGVEFQDLDMPDLKTVDHIANLGADKAAWFNDTEGNVLCIHQGKYTN